MNKQSYPATAGVILAGGQSRRCNGDDKGLLLWHDKPLVSWSADFLQPQCSALIISSNRNRSSYQPFADAVIGDKQLGGLGPLAGIASAMHYVDYLWLMVVAVDCPQLPEQLVDRLHQQLADSTDDACVLSDQYGVQPLVGLYRCTLADSIDAYLDHGNRRVDQWLATVEHRVVPVWGGCDPLKNINTLDQFES